MLFFEDQAEFQNFFHKVFKPRPIQFFYNIVQRPGWKLVKNDLIFGGDSVEVMETEATIDSQREFYHEGVKRNIFYAKQLEMII